MSSTQNNVAVETYSSEYLGSNGNYTITGGNTIAPRYDSSNITINNNATVKLNGITNCYVNASNSQVEFNGAENTTTDITNGNTTVSGGYGNTIRTNNSNLLFSGSTGYNTIITSGPVSMFGADGLILTLNANNPSQSAMFVAGNGNETLNGGASQAATQVWANTSDTNSRLIATTGSGNDTLVGGVGHSTLNGGAGNNLFMFNQSTDSNGSTVIGDFSASSGNRIALYGYNVNVNNLLASSHNDSNGNAVLNLGNHDITIQGVSINNLHSTSFITG